MNNHLYVVSYYDHMIKAHRSRAFGSLALAEAFVELRQDTNAILYSDFTITIIYRY